MQEIAYFGDIKVTDLIKKHCIGQYYQNPDLQNKELVESGWKKQSPDMFLDPSGYFYRGPALAFAIMKERSTKQRY